MTRENSNILSVQCALKAVSRGLLLFWDYKLVVIGAACAALYLIFIFSGMERVLFSDEQDYLAIAKNFIASGIYALHPGVPTGTRPPGYLIFIAPIVALGLAKPGIIFAQILLWGASVYLTGLLSCRLRGPIAGALGILFALVYPLCSFVALTAYPQILTAFLVLLFVWFLLKDTKEALDTRTSIFAGITTGLTILVSPILMPVLFGILAIVPFFSAPVGFRKFRPLMIVVLVSGCIVGPWIGRNVIVLGAPSISTIVGSNLLYGNSENAAPDLGTTADIKKYVEAAHTINEVEQDRAFRNFALEWVRNNPVAATKLYVGKFLQFFAYREVLKTPVANVEFFQNVVAIAYYPLLFLAVVGVIYFAASNGSRGEITMFVIYLMTAAAHAVFLQRFRYRVEVDFLLIVIAANFLASLFPTIDRDKSTAPAMRSPSIT